MIDLTPIDIRNKKGDFPRAIRGYNTTEVDLFLDLAADRLEEVVAETMRLEERLQYVEDTLRTYTERERSLTEALVSAQELQEEARKQAEREAHLVREEAQVEASKIRGEAIRAREQEAITLDRLRARRAQLLDTYRIFLERELGEIRAMADLLGKETSVGGSGPATPEESGPTPTKSTTSGLPDLGPPRISEAEETG